MDNPTTASFRLPAEWEPQRFVQIAWPHVETDWLPYLDEANACYRAIARAVAQREPLVIVTPDPAGVADQLDQIDDLRTENIHIVTCPTNDTWARDHAFLTLTNGHDFQLLDFGFNGWGMKFAACLDNQINATIYDEIAETYYCHCGHHEDEAARHSTSAGHAHHTPDGPHGCDCDCHQYVDCRRIVLEGGSIESDGRGTILTTTSCLLAPNRNYYGNKGEAYAMLHAMLGAERVLWLDHGTLAGDDTDGHIDTLARLCPDDTIVYVQCRDRRDEHFADLAAMERELKAMRTADGRPYRLLALPMPDAIYDDDDDGALSAAARQGEGQRLPATYANYLVINGAVLMPSYGQPANDRAAADVLARAFPGREIVPIDCRVLIRQHGSLHCCTMQYPA